MTDDLAPLTPQLWGGVKTQSPPSLGDLGGYTLNIDFKNSSLNSATPKTLTEPYFALNPPLALARTQSRWVQNYVNFA